MSTVGIPAARAHFVTWRSTQGNGMWSWTTAEARTSRLSCDQAEGRVSTGRSRISWAASRVMSAVPIERDSGDSVHRAEVVTTRTGRDAEYVRTSW